MLFNLSNYSFYVLIIVEDTVIAPALPPGSSPCTLTSLGLAHSCLLVSPQLLAPIACGSVSHMLLSPRARPCHCPPLQPTQILGFPWKLLAPRGPPHPPSPGPWGPQPVGSANCLAPNSSLSHHPASLANDSSLHGHLFVLVSDRLMLLMGHNHFSEVI